MSYQEWAARKVNCGAYWKRIAKERGVYVSTRTADALHCEHIRDIESLMEQDIDDLFRIHNIGVTSIAEISALRDAITKTDLNQNPDGNLQLFSNSDLLSEVLRRLNLKSQAA